MKVLPLAAHCGLLASAGLLLAPMALACPATPEELVSLATTAERAFATMDSSGFQIAYASMRESAACLSAISTPQQAAVVLRVEALAHFLRRDLVSTRAALQAMVEADPSAALSSAVAPEEGELRSLFAAARAMPASPREAASLPPELTLYVDGRPDDARPTARPSLLVVTEGAQPRWSGLMAGTDPMPALEWSPEFERKAEPWPVVKNARTGRRSEGRPLLWAAGGTALVSAGLWTTALIGAGEVQEIQDAILHDKTEAEVGRTAEQAEALRLRTERLGYAAQGTTGLALGLGAVGVIVRW